jgi:hypothetical protein
MESDENAKLIRFILGGLVSVLLIFGSGLLLGCFVRFTVIVERADQEVIQLKYQAIEHDVAFYDDSNVFTWRKKRE